jgi:hypothetical protein
MDHICTDCTLELRVSSPSSDENSRYTSLCRMSHDDTERHKRIDALDDFALSSDPAGCRTLKPVRTLDADCRADFAIDSTALSDGCNCF